MMRLFVGAAGLVLLLIDRVMIELLRVQSGQFVPDWFYLQLTDNGAGLLMYRVISLSMICYGLTATYRIRPQSWYLAGLFAIVLAFRVIAFGIFSGESSLALEAGFPEGLTISILNVAGWIPGYPVMVFLLFVGALQLKRELGSVISTIAAVSSVIFVLTVLVTLLKLPLLADYAVPILRYSSIICVGACAAGLLRLAMTTRAYEDSPPST